MYKQFKPHPVLRTYIDAYWCTQADAAQSVKILPDGCVDILLNTGADYSSAGQTLKHGQIYLVGAMTKPKTVQLAAESSVLGIRFRPAGLSAFFHIMPLKQVTNQTIELDAQVSFDLKALHTEGTAYLDRFFLARLAKPPHQLFPVLADMERHRGLVRIGEVAARHCTTPRQLERAFSQHLGISPKAYLGFLRYRNVMPAIRSRTAGTNLQELAFEYGFYDHAHLTAEVRRYTGLPPTAL